MLADSRALARHHVPYRCTRGAINFQSYTRDTREEHRIRSRARQRDALIFARHYLNGTGITSTFTAVTILPAILVVTITAAASVSIYGGDCAQFIPKLLATDIRKAMTATMVRCNRYFMNYSHAGWNNYRKSQRLISFSASYVTGIHVRDT